VGEAPDSLGPFPLDLDLSPSATHLLEAFLSGAERRARLDEEALKLLGAALWDRLPGEAADLLQRCLAVVSSSKTLSTGNWNPEYAIGAAVFAVA